MKNIEKFVKKSSTLDSGKDLPGENGILLSNEPNSKLAKTLSDGEGKKRLFKIDRENSGMTV